MGMRSLKASLPGFAGNGQCPNLMETTNGDYYLWVNDENAHGPQRWHFVNARNIREQSGGGSLGGVIPPDQPSVCFLHRRDRLKNGNALGELQLGCRFPVRRRIIFTVQP